MPLVSASVTFGFHATPHYLSQPDPYRQFVKDEVDAAIWNELLESQAEQIQALSASLLVNGSGSASDAVVEDLIDGELTNINANHSTNDFSRGSIAAIGYVWYGSVRYCEHSYFCNLNGLPWHVSDQEATPTFYQVLVQAIW